MRREGIVRTAGTLLRSRALALLLQQAVFRDFIRAGEIVSKAARANSGFLPPLSPVRDRTGVCAFTRCAVDARFPPLLAESKREPAPLRLATLPAGGALDARYPYCSNAIAAGLGPYTQGIDREYEWYRDGDGDGVVCER